MTNPTTAILLVALVFGAGIFLRLLARARADAVHLAESMVQTPPPEPPRPRTIPEVSSAD